MKQLNTFFRFSFLAALATLIGCASGTPVSGMLYSDVQGPVNATGSMRGNLHGQACAESYLGLVALGDASISAAAKAGGVNQISHVDHTWTNILGLYAQYCTLVWGSKGGPMAPMPMRVPAPSAPGQVPPPAQPAAPTNSGGL
jgi:hypothetical protein